MKETLATMTEEVVGRTKGERLRNNMKRCCGGRKSKKS
jgi:hypothetical protein